MGGKRTTSDRRRMRISFSERQQGHRRGRHKASIKKAKQQLYDECRKNFRSFISKRASGSLLLFLPPNQPTEMDQGLREKALGLES